ncbi:MAG: argininosuccinate lyase, partial [Deltaproteobacteria bacterium]|nr:argininosuccinate lyase [Deltaproteobacteria bacterium]
MNASVGFDKRLALEDVAVNRAHGRMLHQIGLLSDEERDLIQKGLTEIEAEIKAGQFVFKAELEDVHMNIEAALTERIGPVGAKIHTARSRNDQVAADLRLFLRAGTDQILAGITDLRRSFIDLARTRMNLSPLGTAALAGTTFEVDR